MRRNIMAKTMCAVTALVMAASTLPASVFAVSSSTDTAASSQVYLPCGAGVTMKTDEQLISLEEAQALVKQTQSYVNMRSSRAAYIDSYDFSMGGSAYVENNIKTNYRQYAEVYDAIHTAMTNFTNRDGFGNIEGAVDDKGNPICDSDGNQYYFAVSVDVLDLKIPWSDIDSIKQLAMTYIMANPQHYWNNNVVQVNGAVFSDGSSYVSNINFPVYEQFISGGNRQKAAESIKSKIAEYQKLWTSDMTDLQLVESIHSKLCTDVYYSSAENMNLPASHTIVGAFVNGNCVCEGYAKAFSLLANLAGVSCYMVTGTAKTSTSQGAHAWNIVEIDGAWYYVDATWNDQSSGIIYDYYLAGSDTFDDSHIIGSDTLNVTPSNISKTDYNGTIEPGTTTVDGVEYYEITNADELEWFAAQVNSGETSINGVLTNNIDMLGRTIVPIGSTYANKYTGYFDGAGYAISNFSVTTTGGSVGLFGNTCAAHISGVTVKNANISVSNSTVEYAGAIVGRAEDSSISDCVNENSSVTGNYSGGIVGYASNSSGNPTSILRCRNSGAVTTIMDGKQLCGGGGIIGATGTVIDIAVCENSGTVSYSGTGTGTVKGSFCGGIIGNCLNDSKTTVAYCLNSGSLDSGQFPSGGIVGNTNGETTVSKTINMTDITTGNITDPVVGYSALTPTIEQVYITSASSSRYTVSTLDASEMQSGELAYTLGFSDNGGWGQVIGADSAPSLQYNKNQVFMATFGSTSVYTNEHLSADMIPAGDWVDADGNSAQDYISSLSITKDITFTKSGQVQTQPYISDLGKMRLSESMTYYFYCDMMGVTDTPTLTVSSDGLGSMTAKNVGTETVEGTAYTVFAVDLPAKHIGDKLTATLAVDGKTPSTRTTSAKEYLEALYNGSDEAPKKVAVALLNYATQAQIHKGYNTSTPANASLDEDDKVINTVTPNNFEGNYTFTDGVGGVTMHSAQLDMLSQMRIRINFSLDEKALEQYKEGKLQINYTDPATGSTVTKTLKYLESGYLEEDFGIYGVGSNGRYFFETTGISPLKFAERLTFSFSYSGSTDTVGDTVTYGVHDYFKNMSTSTSTTNIVDLVSAMYAYSKACIEYSNNN